MEIRRITASELSQLLELYRHLHEIDDPLPGPDVLKQTWDQIQNDPRQHCIGVFQNAILIASCILCIIPNLTRACRPYGIIENVVTHKSYRRQGVGKALLLYALGQAWRENCYKVMLLTGRMNEGTYKFYESAGFDRHSKQAFVAKPKNAEPGVVADGSRFSAK